MTEHLMLTGWLTTADGRKPRVRWAPDPCEGWQVTLLGGVICTLWRQGFVRARTYEDGDGRIRWRVWMPNLALPDVTGFERTLEAAIDSVEDVA